MALRSPSPPSLGADCAGTVAAPPAGITRERASDKWAVAEMERCYLGLCSSPWGDNDGPWLPGPAPISLGGRGWLGTMNQSVGAGARDGQDRERELEPLCHGGSGQGNPGRPHLSPPRDSGWYFSSSPALQNSALGFLRPFFDGSTIKAGSLQLLSVLIALLLQWHCGNMSR